MTETYFLIVVQSPVAYFGSNAIRSDLAQICDSIAHSQTSENLLQRT